MSSELERVVKIDVYFATRTRRRKGKFKIKAFKWGRKCVKAYPSSINFLTDLDDNNMDVG